MEPLLTFVQTIWQNEAAFLFVLARVAAFLAAIPLLGGGGTPHSVKALLAFSLAFVLFPVVKGSFPFPPLEVSLGGVVWGLFLEGTIGLMIGLGARLLFAAVEVGGEMAGIQMGFGLANTFDPVSHRQISLMQQVYILRAFALFLVTNGHHLVLRALVASFESVSVPLTGFAVLDPLMSPMIRMGSEMFLLGLQIAAPMILALVLTQIAMGVLSRAVPQLQIFLLSFPLTIGVGLMVFGFSISLYVGLLQDQMRGPLEGRLFDLLFRLRDSRG